MIGVYVRSGDVEVSTLSERRELTRQVFAECGFLRFGLDGDAPFANLRREWPSKDSIGDGYLEITVAIDAGNSLVAL